MEDSLKILSPCGILGYGYPLTSFQEGLADDPDAIVVDAGSTDAGPHKLGAGVPIVSRYACKRDLQPMIRASLARKIPLIIGSAGGSGARVHVEWTLDIIHEILEEEALWAKIAVIWADIPHEAVLDGIQNGLVESMSPNILPLCAETVRETASVVAQMGVEPIIAALDGGADIVVCGRAYDPAPFAAVGIRRGFDPALCVHLGKILECGALCATPGTTKDCIMGALYPDAFEVYPTNPDRVCETVSVAAHTFYEKDHPYLLRGPGMVLDLSACTFEAVNSRRVRVRGSRVQNTPVYTIKLEGARRVGWRSFVVAGIRDPIMIGHLPQAQKDVTEAAKAFFPDPDSYIIDFINYGINGVMGNAEPCLGQGYAPYEVCVLMEVVSRQSQENANDICSYLRSSLLHYGFKGRKSTAGNLAFPFAPSDVPFGPVYEFSIYHTMECKDGLEYFPVEWRNTPHG
ncbi:MAG TPA: acyclic terpene utilization AtuA family protein [Feifaniaceae bacterium]|nr:acyclic terpene utilization AtuA family protein [Feifaniaceae bacterium]